MQARWCAWFGIWLLGPPWDVIAWPHLGVIAGGSIGSSGLVGFLVGGTWMHGQHKHCCGEFLCWLGSCDPEYIVLMKTRFWRTLSPSTCHFWGRIQCRKLNVVVSRCQLLVWFLWSFGDCGTNLLFVGECVRVVMLVGCIFGSGLVVLGVWLHCGSLEQRFVGILGDYWSPEALVDRNRAL